jgi:phage protein U
MIGTFGDVVFTASSDKVNTFDNLQRSTAARWAIHEPHLGYPVPEYLGPGQDSITFTMRFDVTLGVNPREEMDRLLTYARIGYASELTIGGKGLGVGQWYVESVGQTWTVVDNRGNLLAGTVDVTLKEYPL